MIKNLFNKYREIIMYLIFGVLTTAVNIIIYFLCAVQLDLNTAVSTIIAWITAVLFAYITNKFYVFQSNGNLIREIISFFGMRLLSGILDLGIMIIFVDILSYNEMIMKVIANIFVIVFNYVASKFFIFRKNKKGKE